MPPITTNSATGRFFRTPLPSSSRTSAATPSASDVGLVPPRPRRKWPMRSQKSPWLPLKPNSLGSCVLARNSATPHLKPTSTVSEKKLTMVPARAAYASEGQRRDHQRRAGRERGLAGRVAARHLSQRRADQQRNRRGDGDGGLPGAAEQPEHEPAEQARVETRLWRQAGERGVADRRRQQIRRERDAGHDVPAKPRPVVRRQPGARGYRHVPTRGGGA